MKNVRIIRNLSVGGKDTCPAGQVCPAILEIENGDVVVVGEYVNITNSGEFNLKFADYEKAVCIPKSLFLSVGNGIKL